MRTLQRIGIVSLLIGTICMVISSSGVAYSWENNLNWGHDDPVPPDELDVVQTYYMYNCQAHNVMNAPLTGGPIHNPEQIQDMGNWLLFHSHVNLYLYWGVGTPPPPANLDWCYVKAIIILYREIGINNWVIRDSDEDSIRLDAPDLEFHDVHLHVWEQRDYQPGDKYLLRSQVTGYWVDNNGGIHGTGMVMEDRYYEII